jgi:hypothetical protein
MASFLQGVRDSQKPDEEVMASMNEAIRKKMERLSPSERGALQKYLREEGLI